MRREPAVPRAAGVQAPRTFVALLSLGMAFIAPNLSALVSKRGGEQRAGASLGMQNMANSVGQAGGPLLGGVLFIWHVDAPYLFSGAVLLACAVVIAWRVIRTRHDTGRARGTSAIRLTNQGG